MFFKRKTVFFDRKALFIADKYYFSIFYTSGLPNRKTLFIADEQCFSLEKHSLSQKTQFVE